MEFNSILEHKFKDGILIFKTRYVGDIDEAIVDIPFVVLENDEPVIVTRYIKEHVVEDKRQGHYNTWSKKTLKYHTRTIRRLYRLFEMDLKLTKMEQLKIRKINKAKGENKFGIKIPRSVKEALMFDKENKNTKWVDAIAKEIQNLLKLYQN